MTTHSLAVSIEESRRRDTLSGMAKQRAAREEAERSVGKHPALAAPYGSGKVATAAGGVELGDQLQSVLDFMNDGREHTIIDGAAACNCSQTSFSARLRDLRKEKFGGHTVLRRSMGSYCFYRLTA